MVYHVYVTLSDITQAVARTAVRCEAPSPPLFSLPSIPAKFIFFFRIFQTYKVMLRRVFRKIPRMAARGRRPNAGLARAFSSVPGLGPGGGGGGEIFRGKQFVGWDAGRCV
eukprot:1061289-Amorphochlora_amoeboformis.AAC.2